MTYRSLVMSEPRGDALHVPELTGAYYTRVHLLLSATLSTFRTAMEARLAQVSTLPQKDKGAAYVSLISDVLSRADPATAASDIHQIVEAVLQDNVVVGRHVLPELAKSLSNSTVQDTELRKQIVQETLTLVQPRLVSYEEQVSGYTQANAVHLSFILHPGQCVAVHIGRHTRERVSME